MPGPKKTRFVLIGGFLGAGKTTLIGQLARHYVSAGKRVGIITNDQADDLVDTHNLRSQGFAVGEVAGACFCCSFNDLVATSEHLSESGAPDVLLAEPVGSCTDLVATVILPLQQLLGDRFELAPFGVLLKPSHGRRILAAADQDNSQNQNASRRVTRTPRSGFSPQAEYIFRKQLEEADYLMIGRWDELTPEQVTDLTDRLKKSTDVPVIPVSPKTGQGIDRVLEQIESPVISPRHVLEIDYDTYADGEAELGWVNLTANTTTDHPVDLDSVASTIVERIARQIIESNQGQIAHLKTSVLGGDAQSVANVVSNDSPVDMGLKAGRQVTGSIQIIVNARVAMDPDVLEQDCRQQVESVCRDFGLTLDSITAHALRPGRPTPTHRVQA